MIDKYGMADGRSTKTPIPILEEKALSPENITYFRSATGSLLLVSRCTRPDIAHFVTFFTKSMSKPGPRAMIKLKRVLRSLKGTVSIGINYNDNAEGGDELSVQVDSDHAGNLDDGYCTTGMVLYLAGGPVDWRSVEQSVFTISTVRAEFVALSKACMMRLHYISSRDENDK